MECEQGYEWLLKEPISSIRLNIIDPHTSFKPQTTLCVLFFSVRGVVNSQTDGTMTARFKDEWVSGWEQFFQSLCIESTSEDIFTLCTVCALSELRRATTAGSGRFWSSGCQNLQPPHVRQRWEPVPAGRTADLLMCWCRTGKNRCRQTPEREKYKKQCSVYICI